MTKWLGYDKEQTHEITFIASLVHPFIFNYYYAFAIGMYASILDIKERLSYMNSRYKITIPVRKANGTFVSTYRFFIDDVVFEKKALCICTMEYNPVCGSDGRIYGNACAARCAGVTIVACLTPPNPNNLIVNIVPNPMSSIAKAIISTQEEQDGKITIFDTRGRTLEEAKIKLIKGENEWQIDNKNFYTSGIYIFTLQTNQGVITQKIVYTNGASNGFKD